MEFNLADVFEAVARAIPECDAVVQGDRRVSYRELDERTSRLGAHLHRAGLGPRTEPDPDTPTTSHQHHLAVYLYNGHEYLEAMLGAFKARVAPFNVNYRYVADELRYLLDHCRADAVVFDGRFADTLAAVVGDLPRIRTLLQVGGSELMPGAEWYEDALEGADPADAPTKRSPDDHYLLCTGGTTGLPKGVLWRQADIFVASMGGRHRRTRAEYDDVAAIVDTAIHSGNARVMPLPPFMHGAGQWVAIGGLNGGSTIVLPHDVTRLDPGDVWRTIDAEGVNVLLVVGDSFVRPLVDELETGRHDGSSLLTVLSGGAPLHAGLKDRLLARLPGLLVVDAVGASETGTQMSHTSSAGTPATTGTFNPGPDTTVIDHTRTRVLTPGHDGVGWLAQRGRVPLGYLDDPEKTAATFPVIDGVRYAVPGDRARLLADGRVELLGRESVTINSGGEKIFAEEVEQALAHHPDVYDVVVAGRPSARWGTEVVAVVQLRAGAEADEAGMLEIAATHVARFKLPKSFVFVDRVLRSPAGKADYRWAAEIARRVPTS